MGTSQLANSSCFQILPSPESGPLTPFQAPRIWSNLMRASLGRGKRMRNKLSLHRALISAKDQSLTPWRHFVLVASCHDQSRQINVLPVQLPDLDAVCQHGNKPPPSVRPQTPMTGLYHYHIIAWACSRPPRHTYIYEYYY